MQRMKTTFLCIKATENEYMYFYKSLPWRGGDGGHMIDFKNVFISYDQISIFKSAQDYISEHSE